MSELRRKKRFDSILWTIAGLLPALAILTGPAYGAKLRAGVKKESVSVRLVGRAASATVSSFGANHQSYVAVLQEGHNKDAVLVKLVYRFLDYDGDLAALFMDYDLVHRFRAVRQPDCDEATDSVLYSRNLMPTGEASSRAFTFEYAHHAAGVAIPPKTVLPCYVVTPADYKGSDRITNARPASVAAEQESRLASAP